MTSMLQRQKIRDTAFNNGVDLFGIASIDRFVHAPAGFHPRDIYSKTASVIVFAIRLPTESMFAESPVPYTHVNSLVTQKMDMISFDISSTLDRAGIKNVLIPSDDPYEYWDAGNQHGQAILSMRHAAELAGLGKLGRNNLLINKIYGNMIQIGALLTNVKLEPDPLADYEVCPPKCRICLNSCPQQALTGDTVIQSKCRPISNAKNEKGYIIKKCFECRKKCPHALGIRRK
ncbi:epoxyqueuosine reductase [candidate division KSB1 bacterium]|nr:epoxyqueuosine reductase [candidate division KSB1 bacterium]